MEEVGENEVREVDGIVVVRGKIVKIEEIE